MVPRALRQLLPLVFAGAALATTQQLAMREIASALFGEEIVVLLVTVTLFGAISAGYALSPKLVEPRVRAVVFVAGCLVHLAFPMLPRYGFAELASSSIAPLIFAVLLSAVLLAPLATLLPRAVDSFDDRVRGMRLSYAAEVLGFLAGLALAHACFGRPLEVYLGVHWTLLACAIALAVGPRAALVFVLPALILFPGVAERGRRASSALYRAAHGMRQADVIFSVDSPYQRVEVVDNGPGKRSLYLDGLENLNASDLALLNEYLAIVPAKLTRPARTLVIGNGTLSLVAPLAPLTNELLTVEIDPVVVEAGLRFFSPNAARSHPRWRRVEADGKSFLASTNETFDLVIVDVPSPLSFQEAFLHTRELYALLATRLTPRGVAAVQLSGRRLHGVDRSPSRITAALVAELPDAVVVESKIATRAFAYASKELPFRADDVRAVAPPAETQLVVHDRAAVHERVRGVAPLDLDSLALVLRRGLERLVHRREEAR